MVTVCDDHGRERLDRQACPDRVVVTVQMLGYTVSQMGERPGTRSRETVYSLLIGQMVAQGDNDTQL